MSPPEAVTDEGNPYWGVTMKKPVLKRKTRNRVIIALAYGHNLLFPISIVMIPLLIGGANFILFIGIGCCLFAAYTIVGYKLCWKHIYCSFQSTSRKEMTPDDIRWGTLNKRDIYGSSFVFVIVGAACIVCHIVISLNYM